MELLGYTNRLDVAPSDSVQFMVSSGIGEFDVEIVQLIQGDTNPDGPGFKSRPVEHLGTMPGSRHSFPRGSYVAAAVRCSVAVPDGFSVTAWVYPTLLGTVQGLICLGPEPGFALFLTADGHLGFDLGGKTITSKEAFVAKQWHFIGVTCSSSGEVTLFVVPKAPRPLEPAPVFEASPIQVPERLQGSYFVIAALNDLATVEPESAHSHFNGKIAAPRIYLSAVGQQDIGALMENKPPSRLLDATLAAWNFSVSPSGTSVTDESSNAFHGTCVNAPVRAVTSWSYSGGGRSFEDVPHEYDAIMFHADDLDDARWPVSFEYEVPESLGSGVYAARLASRTGDVEDYVPFFVTPSPKRSPAPIAMLMPTFSYLAYANEHYSITNPASPVDFNVWDYVQAEDECARNEELLSLYDYHRDGSGNAHSSMLRPLLNMRPKYHMPLLRGPHQFPADLYIVDWLTEMNFSHDVLTDHLVHREGVELLKKYRVLLTGSHPEYWTEPLWKAVQSYLAQGGRAMYLGGNGMYWSISTHEARPHLIEIQRGHSGTGAWYSLPGEEFTALTGERGGMWRNRGLTPQSLFGVGFTASGYDVSLPYHREPGSYDERAAFIFDGVPPDAVIGDSGLVMGGAAGLEVDRADVSLGTPPHALVVATARRVLGLVPSCRRRGQPVRFQARRDNQSARACRHGLLRGSLRWSGLFSRVHNLERLFVSKCIQQSCFTDNE